jgi:hypothetical protein
VSLNRTQVESWNPATLADIGNAWKAMGSDVEELFSRYKSAVENVNGGHWEGLAADAAVHRAEADRRAAVRLVDHLDRVAQMAIDGFHQVDPPLRRARSAISGAEGSGFAVSEDLTVSYSGTVTPEWETARAQWQVAIYNAASDAEKADHAVRTSLSGARADLRVTFVAPAALGSDQARGDANQLLHDPTHLTPEQIQRLVEAGSLTPAQLVDLASGDMVDIPASQMEYINGLARAMDGKSSQEIEDMLNRLPPEARHGVANALQLLSTTSVTANVRGDRQIPTNGRPNLLPHQMYESLTRDDLVTNGWETVGGWSYNTWNLNGVADNQAAARVAGMSDPTFKHGTGLDAAVLDTAAKYLHAQNAADSDDMFFVDGHGEHEDAPLTDQMFHAVADDRAAVASAVSGQDGQALMSDVFKHEWSDNGKGISELFHISEQDAVADPGNRPDTALATQSGDIAESVARYMSEHHGDLLHLPGDPSTSAGERNPDLMINLADDLAPYYSTFAGAESIPNVGHFHTANELADMYSVLATNPDAGVKAAQATYAQENVLAAMYGSGEGPSTYAQVAGQMQHALESGTASAWKSLDQGDVYKANWDAAVDAATWDTSYKAAGAIINYLPGGSELKALIDVAGPALKPSIVGIVDPSAVTDPGNAIPNESATTLVDSNMTVENIANGLVSKDPSIVNDPDFAPYREVNADGDAYLNVENLNDQAAIRDLLYSRHGINVDSWYTNYTLGMHTGTIAVTGRR